MKDQEEKLIAHYQKALIIKYDNPQIHDQLAKIYHWQLKYERASYHYLKSLRFAPNNLKNYFNLKVALLGLTWAKEKIDFDLLEEGIILIRQIIKNNPNFYVAYVVLGILLNLQGKNKEAIDSYQLSSYQKILLSHPQIVEKHWDIQHKLQPSFMIPGFFKCGTTSLYSYLSTHPQVIPAVDKELWFFCNFFEQDIDYYLAHFPAISNDLGYITGEATPIYINFPRIGKNIFSLFPKMKFIVLLRNPIDRAISSYYHQYPRKYECKLTQSSITKTLEKAPNLINKWFNNSLLFQPTLFLKNHPEYFMNDVLLPHLLFSLYIYYLKQWINIFPREQILILKSENLFNNPSATMKQVYSFLNLSDYHIPEYHNYNPNSYPPISDNIRSQLLEFFRLYNQQLEEYLDMQFNWR